MKAFMRICLSILLGVAVLGAMGSAATKGKKTAKGGGVFFIGNSYTYVNDLPAVVGGLLDAGTKGKGGLPVDSYTRGAASLCEFLDSPKDAPCRDKLATGGFRWVVLQDQSQAPAEIPHMTMRGGRGWADIAKKGGATPVLFITWEHVIRSEDGKFASTPRMQDKLTATYCRLAMETGARVAPVGEAWRKWLKEHPATTLYAKDGSHPNPLGTYMAGCVFYAVLSGNSPVGLPAKVSYGGKTVLQVNAKDAKECQRIAWKVAKSFKPESFLQKLEAREAALPTVDDIRPLLVPGLSLSGISQRLGEPVSTYKSGGKTFRHFLLRGGVELQIICGPSGTPETAMLIPQNAMSEIIKL